MTAIRIRILTSAVAGGLAVALTAAVALASAPLPKTAKAYTTTGNKGGVAITLVTNATNARVIQRGAGAVGSQFAISGGSILCPKAKKNSGFHGTPFAVFGFPGATLELSHGKYGFSKKVTIRNASALGSSAKPFKLKLAIGGSVVSATEISGTVKATGGPCTSKKKLKYRAKLNNGLPVAPGQ